jgi:hypothetical protein
MRDSAVLPVCKQNQKWVCNQLLINPIIRTRTRLISGVHVTIFRSTVKTYELEWRLSSSLPANDLQHPNVTLGIASYTFYILTWCWTNFCFQYSHNPWNGPEIHDATSQKTVFFTVTRVNTSNLTKYWIVSSGISYHSFEEHLEVAFGMLEVGICSSL